jgi:CelD/BcsL family acetyltransferase involved in cellulose biosynthesis
MTTKLELIPYCDLGSIEGEWKEFYQENGEESPFHSFEFLKLWYECFSKPEEIRILKATTETQTIGFLPLVLKTFGPIRVLTGLTNDHCSHSVALVKNGFEREFSLSILNGLFQNMNSWDLFRYGFSYSFSKLPFLVPHELLMDADIFWEIRVQPTYVVRLNKSFDQYYRNDLSLNARRNFSKCMNRLKKSGPYKMSIYRGVEGLNQWETFLEIEDSGWKGNKQSSLKRIPPNYQKYYRNLVRQLAERDVLNMYFLELQNIPIAGLFGYLEGEIFHAKKAGYDEKFKSFSPTNLLIFLIIEDLIKRFPKVRFFHMFPWDYNYKHRYSNMEAKCFETVIFNKTIRGTLFRILSKLKRRIRARIGGVRDISTRTGRN